MCNKFTFFENFKETADKLPDDLRLKFYDAITDYAFKGEEPDDAIIGALVNAFKPSLDKVDNRGGAREGSGAPKGNQNAIKTIKNNQNNQDNSRNNQNNQSFQENKKEEDRNKKEINKEKSFIKPTIEEINLYCQERNNGVSAREFYDFYTSKGWMVGKSPMKDWQAAVRTWENNNKKKEDFKDKYSFF